MLKNRMGGYGWIWVYLVWFTRLTLPKWVREPDKGIPGNTIQRYGMEISESTSSMSSACSSANKIETGYCKMRSEFLKHYSIFDHSEVVLQQPYASSKSFFPAESFGQ